MFYGTDNIMQNIPHIQLEKNWLSMVLDVDFMTLTILKLVFSFIFLELIIYLRASSQDFVENHQFDVVLWYFKKITQSLV